MDTLNSCALGPGLKWNIIAQKWTQAVHWSLFREETWRNGVILMAIFLNRYNLLSLEVRKKIHHPKPSAIDWMIGCFVENFGNLWYLLTRVTFSLGKSVWSHGESPHWVFARVLKTENMRKNEIRKFFLENYHDT